MSRAAVAVVLVAALAACSVDSSGPPPVPAAIALISGDTQTGTAGQALGVPLVVNVTTDAGRGIRGVTISWSATQGGTVSAVSATTNNAGSATATWTLGNTAGENTATASVSGVSGLAATFHATGRAGAPAQIVVTAGDAQTAPAGTQLPLALGARITDAHGNSVDGVTVEWQTDAAAGTFSDAVTSTANGGLVSARWTLGLHAGTLTTGLIARGVTVPPVAHFTATATANGQITAAISFTDAFVAPPFASKAARPDVSAAPILFKGTKPRSLTNSRIVSAMRPHPRRSTEARFSADELIVTYRARRLNAPAIGSLALAAPVNARMVAQSIRTRLATMEARGDLHTRGVSPLLLAAKVRVADASRLDEIAQRLRGDPDVASVERNGFMWRDDIATAVVPTPNDLYYPYQAWHYAMIDAPEAWQITHGSSAVLVAVVDDGTRFDHPDLAANLTQDGYDFVSDDQWPLCAGGTVGNGGDGNGYDSDPTIPIAYDYDDFSGCVAGPSSIGGHGVHVAGTIGAVGNDGVGTTGVNWSIRIRPVRVIGSVGGGTWYDVAQGILYAAGLPADNGAGGTVQAPSAARIINLSLGGGPSSTVQDAVVAASNAGSLIVASAGNSASSDPSYPAAYDQVLSVSAVGPDGTLASYSTYGPTVDISAPGGDSYGHDISWAVLSDIWDFDHNLPAHAWGEGTSMAAPHVTGVAALLLAQNPGLTAAQLRSRLTSYAVDRGAPGRDDLYGAGIVNARNSLTQSLEAPRALYGVLYDATTRARVATVASQGNQVTFSARADGSYLVFAGEDQAGDQLTGEPGRRWGALFAAAEPSAVVVNGAGNYPVSFTIGIPSELESNNSTSTADVLVVGGYLRGVIQDPYADDDYMVVRIPQSGSYTFETRAVDGACGFALEEDTILGLYDETGTQITSNDDVDYDRPNYCSVIHATLKAGTYYLIVSGYIGGRYYVQARAGS